MGERFLSSHQWRRCHCQEELRMLFKVAVDLALPKDAQTYVFSEVCFCSSSGGHHLSGPSFTRGGQPSSGILGALRCCNRAGGPCETHREKMGRTGGDTVSALQVRTERREAPYLGFCVSS